MATQLNSLKCAINEQIFVFILTILAIVVIDWRVFERANICIYFNYPRYCCY
ncbi:Uncharacterised protein [Legionella beliardensis]|uniref:Uncharacterized protein n=1 Tax=Legionella beliardensis TaxID=91822 RepID=A0A378JPQ8_9GAMM|nr:Uncharacterised protein [Legionella beliardensis]